MSLEDRVPLRWGQKAHARRGEEVDGRRRDLGGRDEVLRVVEQGAEVVADPGGVGTKGRDACKGDMDVSERARLTTRVAAALHPHATCVQLQGTDDLACRRREALLSSSARLGFQLSARRAPSLVQSGC